MNKKRILFCGESSHIKSGFGNYTKEILSRLHKYTEYEIAELSCYRTPQVPKTEPWKIYPGAVNSNHQFYQQYVSNGAYVFGAWIFDYVLLHFKPHIVIDIRDPWMFSYQESSPLRKFYHWIISPTYDSSPPKIEFINLFENADTLTFHTDWARKDFGRFSTRQKNIDVVNDSVDTGIFKPISQNKKHHKQIHGIDPKYFVIGSVLRNQKRKLIPDILYILKKVLQIEPNVLLHLHTTFPELNGWDIPNLLLEYGVYDNVLFTYYCKFCEQYSISKYQGFNSICPSCKKQNSMASVTNGLSDIQMAKVYNLFDLYLQYSICEGFGIPQVEAASCGIPLITVDDGAMNEIGTKLEATLIPIEKQFKELETGAFRVYPNNDICINKIIEYINMDKQTINNIGYNIRKKLIENYSWDITAKKFKLLIDSCEITDSWNMPYRDIIKNTVNNNSNIRELIYSILDNVLPDHEYLKRTMFIEDIIYNITNGYSLTNQGMKPFNMQQAIHQIDSYINHTIAIEHIRVGKAKIPEGLMDIMNYA